MVEVIAKILLDGGCREVVVVLGAVADHVLASTSAEKVRVVVNPKGRCVRACLASATGETVAGRIVFRAFPFEGPAFRPCRNLTRSATWLVFRGRHGRQTTKLFSNAYHVAKTALDAGEGQPHSTPAVYSRQAGWKGWPENAEQQFWPGALPGIYLAGSFFRLKCPGQSGFRIRLISWTEPVFPH